jgi:hypothetical protein
VCALVSEAIVQAVVPDVFEALVGLRFPHLGLRALGIAEAVWLVVLLTPWARSAGTVLLSCCMAGMIALTVHADGPVGHRIFLSFALPAHLHVQFWLSMLRVRDRQRVSSPPPNYPTDR